MLRFNTLLTQAGVAPEQVQLVRHQDNRQRRTPYALWRTRPESLEEYQRLQGRDVFDVPGVLATFVVPPRGEALFVGLFQTVSQSMNDAVVTCPLSMESFPAGTMHTYVTTRRPELGELIGKLFVDWGDGTRAWVQRAARQDKPILEIRRSVEEPPYPGHRRLLVSSDEVWSLPRTWCAVLSATGGVYLLVSQVDGAQYVGSATGAEGFLSRWQSYADNGHGGNKLLRERGRPPFLISILEVAGDLQRDEVIALESAWKVRLGSRAHGLNAN